jgi:hypothetical protein
LLCAYFFVREGAKLQRTPRCKRTSPQDKQLIHRVIAIAGAALA